MSKLAAILLCVYLGLAPVAWWPGMSAETLNSIKLAIIALGITAVWLDGLGSGKFRFPSGFLGPLGLFLLIIASSGGFLQSSIDVAIFRIKDYLLGFIMLWTFYIYTRMGNNPERLFIVSSLIIAAHCMLTVSSKFTGFPDWSGPREFIASKLWISGFGSMRTGWSDGVALYVAVIVSSLSSRVGRNTVWKFMLVAAMLAIIVCQIVVGGRAGMLASMLGLVMILWKRGRRRWLVFFACIGFIGGIAMSDYLYTQMRVDQLEAKAGSDIGKGSLNKFSAGRLDNDIAAVGIALENPILGHGFGEVTFRGTEIHNLWLKMFVESGILLPCIFFFVVLSIYSRARRSEKNLLEITKVASKNNNAELEHKTIMLDAYRAIFAMGLLISLVEPRYLLGSFQLSALWWAASGVCAAENIRKQGDD